MKRKISLSRLFDDNRFLTVFAIVVSVMLYITVAMTQQDTTTYTIRDVPVDLSLQSSTLAALGLDMVDDDYTVDVTIRGARTEVPRYDDPTLPELATTVRVSNVTSAGTYTLEVVSAYSDVDALPFEIVSYSPGTIEVTVDKMETKTFDVDMNIQGVTTPPGYVQDGIELTPGQVTISGPKAELEQVASAEVAYKTSDPLTQTITEELPVVLKDAQGNEINRKSSHLTLDSETVSMAITVLKESTLPLRLEFLNMPKDFPEEELRGYMRLSQDSATIAGPSGVVDTLTEFPLGYIDLKELSPENNVFRFSWDLKSISEKLTVLESADTVEASFDTSTWGTATFNISNLQLVNLPADYSVSLVSSQISGVEVVGLQTVLDSLTAEDFVAEVDLSQQDLTIGQQRYPVKISAPGKGLVWALDDRFVYIQVTQE